MALIFDDGGPEFSLEYAKKRQLVKKYGSSVECEAIAYCPMYGDIEKSSRDLARVIDGVPHQVFRIKSYGSDAADAHRRASESIFEQISMSRQYSTYALGPLRGMSFCEQGTEVKVPNNTARRMYESFLRAGEMMPATTVTEEQQYPAIVAEAHLSDIQFKPGKPVGRTLFTSRKMHEAINNYFKDASC